jgi:UbiD family decarboxylase
VATTERTTASTEAFAGFDLRAWVAELADLGELAELPGVSQELEIGAVTDLNAKHRGPALLFTDIVGCEEGRLLTCTLSRAKRLASALGLPPDLDDAGLVEALQGKPATWQAAAPDFVPVVVESGPITERVFAGDEIDMRRWPAPLWHEGDGDRYIGTGGTVITRDPETGIPNCGTYRVSVHGPRRLGVFIEPINHGGIHLQKWHERGERCPVVVSFGHGPLVYLASSMPMPYGVNELAYAGAMAGRPIEVVEGEVTGLPIPACSELAIEGWVAPGDEEDEGPFGEFTGYFAGGREPRPVISVERLYVRGENPIVYGSLPGKPPFDHSYWRSAIESAMLVDRLRSSGIPDVRSAWKYEAGSANFFTVVSIRQRYAGHAMQTGLTAAVVADGSSMGRWVVVVDDDIDVMDVEQVLWALSTRTDPEKSIQVIRDTATNPLDPMLEDRDGAWHTSRAVINACRPYHRRETFGRVVEVSDELAARVRARYGAVLGWPS